MRSSFLFMLDGHSVIPAPDPLTWADWMSNLEERRVGLDTVGIYTASTVFLGYAHPPFMPANLFETAIFGGERIDVINRYQTWDEAAEGHRLAVAALQAQLQDVSDTIEHKGE